MINKLSFENIKQEISAVDILLPKYISQKTPLASLDKIDTEFALALYKDSNVIASKTLIYSFFYNITYFKYRAAINGRYWFDFFYPCIDKTKVMGLGFIEISQNYL